MKNIQITKTELISKEKDKTLRYPNLNTVLMVEDYLQKHRDMPRDCSLPYPDTRARR